MCQETLKSEYECNIRGRLNPQAQWVKLNEGNILGT